MQKNILFVVLCISSFLFFGCSAGGELFKQSVQKTAPKSKEIGPSFAPVTFEYLDVYGTVMTTQEGKALYIYSDDSQGKSNCSDACAIAWPPFVVNYPEDVSGEYGVIEREDGSLQVTFNGMPLYTYTPDPLHKVTGDGKDGKWSVVVQAEDLKVEE